MILERGAADQSGRRARSKWRLTEIMKLSATCCPTESVARQMTSESPTGKMEPGPGEQRTGMNAPLKSRAVTGVQLTSDPAASPASTARSAGNVPSNLGGVGGRTVTRNDRAVAPRALR